MKKRMMVIFIVLSFLVSVIAVAPSISKQATQTQPTSKQPPLGQTSSKKDVARDKFWELEVDHCVLNGVTVQQNLSMDPPDNCCNATVKAGQTAHITCYYKVKTPLVNSITKADAEAWGTGKSYYVDINHPPLDLGKRETRTLPKFTWAVVQLWKQAGQGNSPKIWSFSMGWAITPRQEEVDQHTGVFAFILDNSNEIKEFNENNNLILGWFKVTP